MSLSISENAVKYPVFRHVNGRLIPGFGLKQIAVFAAVGLIGAVLFFATGHIVTVRSVELSSTELLSEEARLKEIRNTLYSDDLLTNMNTDASVNFFDERSGARQVVVTQERVAEAKAEATELGITKSTTDADLIDKIAPSRDREVQVIPTFARLLIFLIVPMTFVIALLIEMGQGFTLKDEIGRWIVWRGQQSLYRYKNRYSVDYFDEEARAVPLGRTRRIP